ncbi:MAG: response regulator [Hyphomicrobiales bacterium]|nr:response regulator [Hyphomicrobiales bacterium]MDE2017318.1 response regulator [Hyphomicrobiales bacterium]
MAIGKDTKVLVVDDFRTMIRILRGLLEEAGITSVDEAADGAEALEKLRRERYDLVISDWNMGVNGGLELLQAIQADPRLAKTPFLMMTAESRTSLVVTAREAGVINYIVKPFSSLALRRKIEQALAA